MPLLPPCRGQRRHLSTTMSSSAKELLPFMERMHVLGSGSIGLLFSSCIRIAFPSYPLSMLLRPHHKGRLQTTPKSRPTMQVCIQRFGRPCLVNLPAEIIGDDDSSYQRTIQNLLLTTKAPDAAIAVTSVVDRLAKNARIIVLCNGALAVREEVHEVLRNHSLVDASVRIHLACTTHGAYRDDDNSDELYHVVHAGVGKTYVEELASLARLWDQSGLMAQSISMDEMSTLLWRKLAANCVINPLSALCQCENGQLLDEPLYHELAEPILNEFVNVANQTTTDNNVVELQELQSFVQDVIKDTARNKSSMWQDVLRRRPTEIQYLNGYVVRKGLEMGVKVSSNQDIVARVEQLTRESNIECSRRVRG